MKKISNYYISVLFFALLIFVSGCEKLFEEATPQSQVLKPACRISTIQDATNLKLIALDLRQNPIQIQTTDLSTGVATKVSFDYNDRGNLIKYNIFNSSSSTDPNAFIQYYYPKNSCNPDSADLNIKTYVNDVLTLVKAGSIVYSYDANDLLAKQTTWVSFGQTAQTTVTRFEYDSSFNLTKIYSKLNTDAEYLTNEFIGFDDKINNNRSNRTWMVIYSRYGQHNPLTETTYDNLGNVTYQYTYNYEYNTNGFPTKITRITGNVIKPSDITVTDVTYNCD